MKQKTELRIEYEGLICANCKQPIIWHASDKDGKNLTELRHLKVVEKPTETLIIISKKCGYSNCKEPSV